MIRSILYATDLGLYAPYVLQHALTLARVHHADLYVLHVVEPLGLFAESLLQTYLDADSLSDLHQHGLERVMASIEQRVFEGFCDELQESAEDALPIRAVQVQLGDPPQVILQLAEDLAVELIVIGSHSQSLQPGAALGRTCLRLLQQARVPVYLVPILPEGSESR
ncbi:universal stress protein [Pseudomonas sp. AN-1]|uniref:universal stress protein n=1 Tax=Pseudomonas sp. AN-1 TaxID=3096605 RepID=UPI002A6AE726|nr:universal stress protein [Pseudomonas sp. AN-1]WPP46140.1 universal stress protein [Pseudomonas sp. AN-1]